MSNDPTYASLPDDQPIVTFGHLRKLKEEVEAANIAAQRAVEYASERRARLDEVERLISAIAGSIVPGALPAQIRKERKPAKAKRKRNVTYTGEIKAALARSSQGYLGYADLKDELSRGPIGVRMVDKSFHGALGKLEEAGDLVRYNEHAFLSAVYTSFRAALARGEVEDIKPLESNRNSPTYDAFLAFVTLHARSKSLTAAQIIDGVIREFPNASASLVKARTGGYNILKRLIEREILLKDEKLKTYRLSPFVAAEIESGTASKEAIPDKEASASFFNGSLPGLGPLP